MRQTFWKCNTEGCDDTQIYRHKGLCRNCTEYSAAGEVITPQPRIRVNGDGSIHQKIDVVSRGRPITRAEQTQVARNQAYHSKVQTKIRKARQAMVAEGIDPKVAAQAILDQTQISHECADPECADPTCTTDFEGVEIGESIITEEE